MANRDTVLSRPPLLVCLAAAILCLAMLPAHAADKGWFGFALAIDADGIFNPTLRSIKVDKIVPGSPAAAADLAPGDVVLQVEGIVVEGARADVLKAAIQKSVGETLHLKIRHGIEPARDVTLVAAVKPAG